MNALIALAVICIAIACLLGLVAGVFKILIFKGFRMNQAWFDFKLTLRDVKLEWESGQKRKDAVLKAVYLLFNFFAMALFYFGLISLALGTFLRK